MLPWFSGCVEVGLRTPKLGGVRSMVGGGGLPPHHKAPSTAAYNSWLYMRSTEWSRRRATSAQPSLFTSRGNCSIIGRRGAAKCPHYQLHTPVSPNPKSSPITKFNPHSPIGKRVSVSVDIVRRYSVSSILFCFNIVHFSCQHL